MTARYGRSAFKPKRCRLSDRAFFVSRRPGAWLVVGENLCFFHFALCRFLSFFFPLFPSFPLCSFPLPSFCPSFSRPLSFSLFSSRIFFLSLRIFPLFSFLLLFSADKKRLCRCGKGNPQPEAKAFFMNVIYV